MDVPSAACETSSAVELATGQKPTVDSHRRFISKPFASGDASAISGPGASESNIIRI
jgi:hypothetical protein